MGGRSGLGVWSGPRRSFNHRGAQRGALALACRSLREQNPFFGCQPGSGRDASLSMTNSFAELGYRNGDSRPASDQHPATACLLHPVVNLDSPAADFFEEGFGGDVPFLQDCAALAYGAHTHHLAVSYTHL